MVTEDHPFRPSGPGFAWLAGGRRRDGRVAVLPVWSKRHPVVRIGTHKEFRRCAGLRWGSVSDAELHAPREMGTPHRHTQDRSFARWPSAGSCPRARSIAFQSGVIVSDGILISALKSLLSKRNRQLLVSGLPDAAPAMDIRQEEGGSILCFSGGSEGNALMELTKQLLEPLKSRASRVVVLDVNQEGWQSRLESLLDEPVWFAVSYFAVGQDVSLTRDGTRANLWESAGIPFVRFYGDLPAYFPDRHIGRYRNSINVYGYPSHAAYYRRWFSDRALSVLVQPFILDPIALEDVDVERKMKGKVIFPKNGNSPASLIIYWRTALPREVGKALEALAEESVGKDWIDREPCLDDKLIAHFSTMGVDIAAEPAVLSFLVAQLDDYVRRVKSTMIAEALLDLPVIVRGSAWQHVDFRGKKAVYDPDSDLARTNVLMDQALAIVDMSPNTQHTPHDRICRSVGRGTAFLTNRQEFLDALLPKPARFTFKFEPEAIRNCVEYYVDRPRDAVELGLEQARAMRPAFREDRFVDALATAVDLCRFRLAGRPAGTQDFVAFPPHLYL